MELEICQITRHVYTELTSVNAPTVDQAMLSNTPNTNRALFKTATDLTSGSWIELTLLSQTVIFSFHLLILYVFVFFYQQEKFQILVQITYSLLRMRNFKFLPHLKLLEVNRIRTSLTKLKIFKICFKNFNTFSCSSSKTGINVQIHSSTTTPNNLYQDIRFVTTKFPFSSNEMLLDSSLSNFIKSSKPV